MWSYILLTLLKIKAYIVMYIIYFTSNFIIFTDFNDLSKKKIFRKRNKILKDVKDQLLNIFLINTGYSFYQ